MSKLMKLYLQTITMLTLQHSMAKTNQTGWDRMGEYIAELQKGIKELLPCEEMELLNQIEQSGA